MKKSDLLSRPHRRLNLLTGEWILVSPERTKRPWKGKVEKPSGVTAPKHDPNCYLCPGNVRANGESNPKYTHTFIFDNDFSALKLETKEAEFVDSDLLVAKSEKGICRVVCFSPRHDLTLPEMSAEDIKRVVEVWTDEYKRLGKNAFINYVQIFENKGELMGASNPHPHCQIWAEISIPVEPAKELVQMRKYLDEKKRCLLCDYLDIESKQKVRLVAENDDFIVVVPFWAVWPFETLVVSKRHLGSLTEMTDSERQSFSDVLKRITVRYDNLFEVSFPYSAGIHQSPTDGREHPEVHFHMHFYPPLLRSASVKKFMVGYEMLANPQRDISPEISAEKLRELSEIHFKERTGNNIRASLKM